MSKPRLCGDCAHPVGNHSHMVPHPCKVDRCGCAAYNRQSISSLSHMTVSESYPRTQEGTK